MKLTATIHMCEAEVALDPNGVLAKVRQGVEIVIEQAKSASGIGAQSSFSS